mmetsp:Transcript_112893/g.360578  ORF Transcript_112893/g.360578 Transcript_112893/m.360578 type:complete len:294 (+) Transcript_112893:512-1393(+)
MRREDAHCRVHLLYGIDPLGVQNPGICIEHPLDVLEEALEATLREAGNGKRAPDDPEAAARPVDGGGLQHFCVWHQEELTVVLQNLRIGESDLPNNPLELVRPLVSDPVPFDEGPADLQKNTAGDVLQDLLRSKADGDAAEAAQGHDLRGPHPEEPQPRHHTAGNDDARAQAADGCGHVGKSLVWVPMGVLDGLVILLDPVPKCARWRVAINRPAGRPLDGPEVLSDARAGGRKPEAADEACQACATAVRRDHSNEGELQHHARLDWLQEHLREEADQGQADRLLQRYGELSH